MSNEHVWSGSDLNKVINISFKTTSGDPEMKARAEYFTKVVSNPEFDLKITVLDSNIQEFFGSLAYCLDQGLSPKEAIKALSSLPTFTQGRLVGESKIDEMGCAGAGAMGFQLPLGVKNRKKKLDKVMESHTDIKLPHMMVFLQALSESRGTRKDGVCADCGAPTKGFGGTIEGRDFCDDCYDHRDPVTEKVCKCLDDDKMDEVADMVRESVVRKVVRSKITEVVRKKDGKYVLYAPNKGKKKSSKPIGTFPTKLAAKRAELAHFPPKDPSKAKDKRKKLDKLSKNPKKAAEKQKNESILSTSKIVEEASKAVLETAILSRLVRQHVRIRIMNEGLFQEEAGGSEWDDYIKKISDRALSSDKTFQRYNKAIEKASEGILLSAFGTITKALRGTAKVRNLGMKRHDDGRLYLGLSIDTEIPLEPVYVYVDRGVPRVEFSDSAKAALAKLSPEASKAIRAELSSIQDGGVDSQTIAIAVGKRDKYLERIEARVDAMLANMTPLELSLVKNLLVKKYRKA